MPTIKNAHIKDVTIILFSYVNHTTLFLVIAYTKYAAPDPIKN